MVKKLPIGIQTFEKLIESTKGKVFGSSGNSVLSGRQLSVPDLRQQAESIVE
jgi:hypothetical protein